MAGNWRAYQEEAAEFFRSLGLKASTDVTLNGVRTKHDVDVLVEIDVAGFTVRWIVECKHWKDAVNKLHVMALREIVSDLGADRGIILCEMGYQVGAVEAANLTNVQVTSLGELSVTSRDAIASVRLRELFDRVAICRYRYWEIPKAMRIETGLRPDFGDVQLYTGIFVIEVIEKYLGLAFRAAFPITVEPFDVMKLDRQVPEILGSSQEVISAFEPLVAELESKLDAAVTELANRPSSGVQP
jgi:restriction system protein